MRKFLNKVLAADPVTDGLGLTGAALLARGFYLAWPPLGYIVGGALLMGWAVMASRAAVQTPKGTRP
ncbi:MAG: hypothetical protein WCD42_13795 [Rhizomicrobium sp.]